MKSIKELYRIGTGPSSSHTMGPRKAAEMFLERHPDAASFKVTLYGSLAATGKGHMTDVAIIDTLQPTAPVEIVWQPKVFLPFHPNGMTFAALDSRRLKRTLKLPHGAEINMAIPCGIRDGNKGIWGERCRVPFEDVYRKL